MPKINHPNIGDIQQYAYLQGIVASVDAGNDTACISIPDISMEASDIPLFYHCSHDAVERNNGALEGAAAAFTEDDEVIVQCWIVEGAGHEAVRVIGFVGGIKSCHWEPWGENLADNHPWYTGGTAEFAGSIIDGVYTFDATNTYAGARDFDIIWDKDDEDLQENPSYPNGLKLKIKIKADIITAGEHYPYLPSMGDNVESWIYDSAGKELVLVFADNAVDRPYGELWEGGPTVVFVGDNNGEEQIIDLSSYGFTGQVVWMSVETYLFEGAHITYNLDYLDFSS